MTPADTVSQPCHHMTMTSLRGTAGLVDWQGYFPGNYSDFDCVSQLAIVTHTMKTEFVCVFIEIVPGRDYVKRSCILGRQLSMPE